MEELTKHAEQGDAEAQFKLAMAYYQGNGIEINHEKAIEWWTKAAEKGLVEANYCIGCIHFDRKEYKTAMEYFLKAVENPIINEAAFQLGVMYEVGLGTKKDNEKAAEYYKKGARGLNYASYLATDALKRLGIIHSWSELDYSHQTLCEEAKRRINGTWEELLCSFSFMNSGIWLKIKNK